VDQNSLEEVCAEVLGRELIANFRENNLNLKSEELVNREQ
jgi:hypothetical protein